MNLLRYLTLVTLALFQFFAIPYLALQGMVNHPDQSWEIIQAMIVTIICSTCGMVFLLKKIRRVKRLAKYTKHRATRKTKQHPV